MHIIYVSCMVKPLYIHFREIALLIATVVKLNNHEARSEFRTVLKAFSEMKFLT